jgi:hypothetical protein
MEPAHTSCDPVIVEELERAAADLVDFLRKPFELLKPGQDPKPFIGLLVRALEDPDGLKRDIVAEALKHHPDQLRQDIALMSELKRSPRKFLLSILKEGLPAGTPGKRPQITESKEQQMILVAMSLLPAVQKLVGLRAIKTKRTVAESVQYLATEFPKDQSELLLKHADVLEAFFSDLGGQPKPERARARRLVYRVVGREFGISQSYAERWLGPMLNDPKSDKLKK